MGGRQDDSWNNRFSNRLLNALPVTHSAEGRDEFATATIAGVVSINNTVRAH
jgi:hypothetical protein